jgi:hypothetical protein
MDVGRERKKGKKRKSIKSLRHPVGERKKSSALGGKVRETLGRVNSISSNGVKSDSIESLAVYQLMTLVKKPET